MKTLVFSFYGEGIRDYGFLMIIVVRTLNRLLVNTDINDPFEIKVDVPETKQHEKMMLAAKEAEGHEFLVFHLDADSRDWDAAYKERFEPGYNYIQQSSDKLNKMIIPIIPIKVTDSWMLVDFEAFRKAASIPKKFKAKDLNFPSHPQQVEAVANPKVIFENAIREGWKERGKSKIPKVVEVYTPLARYLNLDLLDRVSAYARFKSDLAKTLKFLHYDVIED